MQKPMRVATRVWLEHRLVDVHQYNVRMIGNYYAMWCEHCFRWHYYEEGVLEMSKCACKCSPLSGILLNLIPSGWLTTREYDMKFTQTVSMYNKCKEQAR
jgi:hypothetical protein